MTQQTHQEVLVKIQATPNPNAWKFILDRPVLIEGKATFTTPEEAKGVKLAESLFDLLGVTQVHFFQNVITLTLDEHINPYDLHPQAISVIQTRYALHNPEFNTFQKMKPKRQIDLTPEMQKIDEILDRTVRPGLQGDGGDIELLSFEPNDKKVYIHYQGACGTCPSSTSGTLMAIESILRDEFDPAIEVVPV